MTAAQLAALLDEKRASGGPIVLTRDVAKQIQLALENRSR